MRSNLSQSWAEKPLGGHLSQHSRHLFNPPPAELRGLSPTPLLALRQRRQPISPGAPSQEQAELAAPGWPRRETAEPGSPSGGRRQRGASGARRGVRGRRPRGGEAARSGAVPGGRSRAGPGRAGLGLGLGWAETSERASGWRWESGRGTAAAWLRRKARTSCVSPTGWQPCPTASTARRSPTWPSQVRAAPRVPCPSAAPGAGGADG